MSAQSCQASGWFIFCDSWSNLQPFCCLSLSSTQHATARKPLQASLSLWLSSWSFPKMLRLCFSEWDRRHYTKGLWFLETITVDFSILRMYIFAGSNIKVSSVTEISVKLPVAERCFQRAERLISGSNRVAHFHTDQRSRLHIMSDFYLRGDLCPACPSVCL